MDRREISEEFHLAKSLHCPFSPSEGLVRVFRPIVQPTACLLARAVADRS